MPTWKCDMGDPKSADDCLSDPQSSVGYKSLPMTGPDCAVCTDHAPQNSCYRRHYGVICCEACKCFFRRTVQMNRDYKCRSDGNCYVGRTTENQKQVCQACRFQQCIKAGMKVDSVKRFPRKSRNSDVSQEDAESKAAGKNSKLRGKRGRSNGHKDPSPPIKRERSPMPSDTNGVASGFSEEAGEGTRILGPRERNNVGDELQLCDTDLANVKFKMSPSEAMQYLQSASTTVPQLFKYDSMDNLHERSVLAPGLAHRETCTVAEGRTPSLTSMSSGRHAQAGGNAPDSNRGHPKRGVVTQLRPAFEDELLAKKVCLKGVGPTSLTHKGRNLSTPPVTPLTPSPHSQPPSQPHSPAHPRSRQCSPEPICASNVSAYESPYMTPHGTPSHTPLQSPLSSPTTLLSHPPGYHHHANLSPEGVVASNGNPSPGDKWHQRGDIHNSAVGHFSVPGGTPQFRVQPPPAASPGAIIFNSHPTTVPFQVLASTSLLPMVLSTHPHQLLTGNTANKSPFRIIPIPSINRTQPEEVPSEPEVNVCDSPDNRGDRKLSLPPGSAPSSARSSPTLHKAKKFHSNHLTKADTVHAHFAEAKLEEVLDSLRLRIRSLFTWAKSEVSGFDDLSPLDQKALLRRTVPELVMLGFARGSIAYNDLLLLGSMGKVIRPTNENSGVASVASVTLQKLVVPLKVLNIDDRELTLLKEIVLFNPESNGLRNREVVRVYRKNKHLKLMEYTEKSDDPGRFGELLCLLTPLFEVSTEVTEQLRLEQFVHEGEARIDALLLMSMISGADEMPDEHSLDSQQLL